MAEMQLSVSSGRKFSAVWIIPLVALVIGVWMVIYAFMTEGPTITIDFKTAEGLEAGKTKVRLLNLEVGHVEDLAPVMPYCSRAIRSGASNRRSSIPTGARFATMSLSTRRFTSWFIAPPGSGILAAFPSMPPRRVSRLT